MVPASIVSLPLPALIVSTSVASAPVMATCAARPLTVTELPEAITWIWSLPPVPVTVTWSIEPSPVPVPGVALRSSATCVTPVPVRSPTVMVSAPPRAVKLICSTLLRSIVMLATSRVNRARVPLAVMSIFSLMLAPLNWSVSVPSWPSTVSLPSPGFQTKVSSAGAAEQGIIAAAAGDEVVAIAAEQPVGAVAAGDGVVTGAAVHGNRDEAGETVAGGEGVVAAVQR